MTTAATAMTTTARKRTQARAITAPRERARPSQAPLAGAVLFLLLGMLGAEVALFGLAEGGYVGAAMLAIATGMLGRSVLIDHATR